MNIFQNKMQVSSVILYNLQRLRATFQALEVLFAGVISIQQNCDVLPFFMSATYQRVCYLELDEHRHMSFFADGSVQ